MYEAETRGERGVAEVDGAVQIESMFVVGEDRKVTMREMRDEVQKYGEVLGLAVEAMTVVEDILDDVEERLAAVEVRLDAGDGKLFGDLLRQMNNRLVDVERRLETGNETADERVTKMGPALSDADWDVRTD